MAISAASSIHHAARGEKAVGFDAGENAGGERNSGSEATPARRNSASQFNLEGESGGEGDDEGAGSRGEATLNAFAFRRGEGGTMRRANAWRRGRRR